MAFTRLTFEGTIRSRAALLLGTPLIAILLMKFPVILAAPVAIAAIAWTIRFPAHATGVFVFSHIALPVYMRVPFPGLDVPVSTSWMLFVMGSGVLAWLAGSQSPPRLGQKGSITVKIFIVFAVVITSSVINPRSDIETLKMWGIDILFPALALILIVVAARGTKDLLIIEAYLVAGAIVASAYAGYELAIGDNPLLGYFEIETVSGYATREELGGVVYRCFSVYLNPIEFGAVMGMILPFSIIRAVTAGTSPERTIFGIASAIIIGGILLSVSRGPILGLAIQIVLIGIVFKRLRPILIAALAIGAFSLLLAWPFVGARLEDRFNDFDNITMRIKLFKTAFALFLDNPVRGVGLGNFPVYYLDTIRDLHIGPFFELGGNRVEHVRVAENTYLQLAAETGIVGVLAAIAAVTALLGLCFRIASDTSGGQASNLAKAAAISVVVYGVNAMSVTAYTLFGPTLLIIGLLPAIALVLDRHHIKRIPSPIGHLPQK